MAQQITLSQISNQSFGVALDNVNYTITLQSCLGLTIISISVDDNVLVSSIPCTPNQPLLPDYKKQGGQFYFVCEEGEYPYYDNFNIKTFLVYVSDSEV